MSKKENRKGENDEAMNSEAVPLSQIVKDLTIENDFCDPFHDDFDFDLFIKAISDIEERSNIDYDKQGIETFRSILTLNQIFESLMLEIEEKIVESGYAESRLTEAIFIYANASFLNIFRLAKEESTKRISSEKIGDFTVQPALLIDNADGEKSGVQGAIDNNVDVVNELFDIVSSFAPNTDNEKYNEDKLLNFVHIISVLASQLVSIKNAFKEYQYEFGKIERSDLKKIKFLGDHPNYKFLKEAGGIRSTKLIQEHLFRTGLYLDEGVREIVVPKIKNGYLKISNQTKEIKTFESNVAWTQCATYFFHLKEAKLKRLNDCSINDLVTFIISTKNLFRNVYDDSFNPSEIAHIYAEVPFRIKKKDFVDYIYKDTKLSKRLIGVLISDLTSNDSREYNLWKKPFFRHKGDLLFVIPAIEGGHFEYLLNIFIKKYIPLKYQISRFIKDFESRLDDIKHQYEFKKLESDEVNSLLGDSSEGVVICTLKSKIVLFKICLVDFPIESSEYHQVVYRFWQTSQNIKQLSEKIRNSKLKEFENKEIIHVGVINFPSLSGFEIDGTYFMDPILISNYFSVGELQRVRMKLDNKFNQDEISTFKYYENEKDFNDNFEQFCYSPEPIVEIISRLTFKNFKITYSDAPYTIYREGLVVSNLSQSIDYQINEIEYYFDQLYYFEKELDREEHSNSYLHRKLGYLVPITLNFISIGSNKREDRIRLLRCFNNAKVRGLGYLILSIQKELVSVHKLNLRPDHELPKIPDKLDAKKLTDKCIEEVLREHGSVFGMSSISFGKDLKDEELDAVLAYMYDELAVLRARFYTEEELELFLIHISIMAGFIEGKEKYYKILQDAFLNFIDVLNFNYKYQKARDVCEEILEFSFKKAPNQSLGWLCLFKCYLKQNSLNEAAYYLALYLGSITSETEVSKYQLHDALYNAFLFFRDMGIDELAENIFEILSALNPDNSEEQKITLSYYNLRLRKLYEDDFSVLDDAINYLDKNWESIFAFGSSAVLPWLALMFNLKNIHTAKGVDIPDHLEKNILKLKDAIDKETLIELESIYFPVDQQTKKSLDRALSGVFDSRYFEDFATEVSNLELLSKNTLALSINPLDLNYLLKSGIALNDNFLTFAERKNHPHQSPFITGNSKDILEFLDTYAKRLLSNITLKDDQIVLWFFTLEKSLFVFQLKHDKSYSIRQIENWDKEKFNSWRANINTFVFPDLPDYSINVQEQEYVNYIDRLNFTALDVADQYTDVLVYFSLDLSMMPHNLLLIKRAQEKDIHEKHEELVKDKIRSHKHDFIGIYKSVTNIFSLEWLYEKGQDILIAKSKFTISGWSPLEDEDYTLLVGAAKLEPVIKKYKGVFHHDLVPKHVLNSELNFFLAHGEKGIEGFKSVYSRQDEAAHAILKGGGVKRIFGSGKIALLFICNSASINPEIHSNMLNSFINQIMSLGYKTVIAPAWQLNADIPAVWMDIFLKYFIQGIRVSICVQKANEAIAFSGYNEYKGFYDSSGWAAMHIYGNPNISIDVNS